MQSLGLVFVAVYQSALKLMYVDKLLQRVKSLFAEQYSPKKFSYVDFEGQFKRELEKAEQVSDSRLKAQQPLQGNLTNRKVGATLCQRARQNMHECMCSRLLLHAGKNDHNSTFVPCPVSSLKMHLSAFMIACNLLRQARFCVKNGNPG